MIIQAIKVSALIFFVYLSYISYFDYKESIQAQQTEQFTYNKQKLTKNNLWSQQQFKSINNNLHKLKFSVNYQTSLITLSLGNNRNAILSFDDLDLQQQDVRQINSIQVIEINDLVIKIQSQYFTLVYSISDKAICYERISFYANQQIFFVDHNKNLWIFTHPNNNMVLLRVYNRKRQQIMLSRYLPKSKIQLLIEFRPDEKEKQVRLRFLTFSRNYLILTFNTENFSIKSEEQVQSHAFNYFQNEIKQFTIGLSQKILDIQTYNLIQRLIHKLTFGFMGKLIKDNNYTTTSQQRFAASVIDPENAVVLEFNQFYNETQLVSFGQVLIPMRTPVFINKNDQQKLITFDEALNRSRDNEEIPSVNFKLYGIKSKNLEMLRGKGGIYRMLPDAKVHFMTFNRRLLEFYPKENLNQEQFYIVRTPNGGIALKGSQIKGIFQQLPVYNKSATQLKFGYSKEQVYHEMTTNGLQMGHSIYEAHAMHKGLFARSYKNRVQLITSLSGKSVLTHYLSTKNQYEYSTSYIENNQFWVFEHKQNSFPLITKYELFLNSSSPRTILSIKRNYQINIVARITQVQKCIDYYYYFTYVTQDYKYGVARVHHALMSNRQARSDEKYAGQFQKMMVIPNMQRNDQFFVSSIEEDLLTVEFQVDPNVVKSWKKLELKHQYRVLPIRVYLHMNQYYIFDLRKIMVQAFNKEIISTKKSFLYNSFVISVVMSSIIILIIILTSKRSEEPIEQKSKVEQEQKNANSKEKQKEKEKDKEKEKKKKNKQD